MPTQEASPSGGASSGSSAAPAAAAATAAAAAGSKVYVHPEATIKGSVTLGTGCCICAAARLEGGAGGLVLGERTVVKEKVTIINKLSTPMVIGSCCIFDEASTIRDVKLIEDFVHIGARATVCGVESLGAGSSVVPNCEVTSGAPPVGPQEVVWGLARRAFDPDAIVRQAQALATDLPYLQQQLQQS